MTKKKVTDKVYAAPTNSAVVEHFQKLLKDPKGLWVTVVNEKEMRFIYDMLAKAEATPGFQPTPGQSRWGIAIIKKIEQALVALKSNHCAKSKTPSVREDAAARRKFKKT